MYPYNKYPIFGMRNLFWCIIMVRDDDNVKFEDKKHNKATSERSKQFAEELKFQATILKLMNFSRLLRSVHG